MPKHGGAAIHFPENDSITYLVGGMTISKRSRPPYDSRYCDFLNDISAELRLQKDSATFSDVMSFAYWCRKANIHKLKTDFENGKSRLGLGLVFHVTPSNVPVNFAFSYVSISQTMKSSNLFDQSNIVLTLIC